jgi:signal transduction histidine kinase
MIAAIAGSMRRKLISVVLAATLSALLASSIALFLYDLRAYETSARNDLIAQADILAYASAAALMFNDPAAARENLLTLEPRPQILAARIYTLDRDPFAAYERPGVRVDEPEAVPTTTDYRIEGSEQVLFQPIKHKGETVGVIYLRARYEIWQRLRDYLGILVAAMGISMLVAFLVSMTLQAAITEPILGVTRVARVVLEKRDYSQRVVKTTHDEIGVLVDAFNEMLSEVGKRSAALEASNVTLQHEMSERRLAEEALRAADRRKDEFLATLAHELRNPLAPIRNALHIMHLAKGDQQVIEQARATMDRQLTQMVRLVDDLLDVSRISRDALELRTERADLASILRSALETSRPLIGQARQALVVKMPPDPIWVDADVTRLAQVFSNLLNNASKYSSEGGNIHLTVERLEGHATIAVRDDGIGIPPDMLSKVFDMFTQIDRSLEKTQGGLGMGLTIVRRLVEMHGGTVEARSEGIGKGSEFVVQVPLAAPEGAAGRPARVVAEPAAPVGRKILVVDDHKDSARSMAMMLELMGNRTQVAHDGIEALEVAAEFRPEVILLDIGMPRLNGYETARRVRESAWGKDVLLVALTGWGQDVDKARSAEAGFDVHLVKPVASEVLVKLLA